jgi:hypothetical protein
MSLRKLGLIFLMMFLGLSSCSRQKNDIGSAAGKVEEKSPQTKIGDKAPVSVASVQGIQSEVNHLPEILSTTLVDPYIHHGVDIEVVTEVEDPDFDTITLDYRWFLNGAELLEEKEDVLSGDLFIKGDKIALWITPSDQYGRGRIFYSSEIIIPNAPPEFSTQDVPVIKGEILTLTIKATDPDNDRLTFDLENAPEGMRINPDSGELYWPRKIDQSGPYQVNIIVKDEEGAQSILALKFGVQIEK